MVMLFIAFLGIDIKKGILQLDHLKVLVLNLLLPLCWYGLLLPNNHTLALAGFVIGITPTAAGAPVIAGFLKGRVDFVTASVLLTSPVVALVIPFVLPWVIGGAVEVAALQVIFPVFSVVFIPLVLSMGIKLGVPKLLGPLHKIRFLAFYLFLLNVLIASGKATDFIFNQLSGELNLVFGIAGVSGVVCFVQFQLGARMGKKESHIERSLSLARKNTMFAIWICLTFITPIVALSPMFYILFQNLYNSVELFQVNKK